MKEQLFKTEKLKWWCIHCTYLVNRRWPHLHYDHSFPPQILYENNWQETRLLNYTRHHPAKYHRCLEGNCMYTLTSLMVYVNRCKFTVLTLADRLFQLCQLCDIQVDCKQRLHRSNQRSHHKLFPNVHCSRPQVDQHCYQGRCLKVIFVKLALLLPLK